MLVNEEAGLDSASLRDLRSMTDLALRATKATAQAIGHSMSSLIVLERQIWLTMTKMKEADKVPDLRRLSRQLNQCQPPRSPDLLRVSEIEGAHVRHDATPSRGAKDPGPRLPWIRHLRNPPEQPDRKRRGPSPVTAEPPRKQPLLCLSPSRLALGTKESVVHGSSRAHYRAQVSNRCDSRQNKTHTFSKREQKSFFLPTISVLPLCSQYAQPFKPLATRAGEAWQAIPGVSTWVMTTVKTRLYTTIRSKTTTLPQCACHHSENTQVLLTEVMNLLEKGAIESPGAAARLPTAPSVCALGWV